MCYSQVADAILSVDLSCGSRLHPEPIGSDEALCHACTVNAGDGTALLVKSTATRCFSFADHQSPRLTRLLRILPFTASNLVA
jgi:hypothetical protein